MYIKVRRGLARGDRDGKLLNRGSGSRRKVWRVENDCNHKDGLWRLVDRRDSVDRSCELGLIVRLNERCDEGRSFMRFSRMCKDMEINSVLDMSKVIRRLGDLEVGDKVCHINSKYIRSGGMYGVVVDNTALFQRGKKGRVVRTFSRGKFLSGDELKGKVIIRLRGRKLKEFDEDWTVREGVMSSSDKLYIRDGFMDKRDGFVMRFSAGDMRRRGFRPKVRMKAMNAVDRRYSSKKGVLT